VEENILNIPDSLKPYDLSFQYRPRYLYVYVTGERDSYEISKQYWQEIAAECRRSDCKKVLIEEDITEIVSTGEMYKIASEIPQMGFFGIRIAFVDRRIEHQDLNQFGELVATNRGIYGKIFNDVEESEKWLLSE
jgi:hypothetical protein